MRRTVFILLSALLVVALAAPAAVAKTEKYTFNDVALTEELTGEIEATVKDQKNKSDSVECSYFTDDYEEHLGNHFEFVDEAPTERDEVRAFCLERFEDAGS